MKKLLLILVLSVILSAVASAADNVTVLLYHDLYEKELPAEADASFCTTVEKFEYDIASLLDAGCLPLSLGEYYSGDYDENRKYFIVTFDDGYLSNYELAYPVLVRNEVSADIFICTEMTGRSNHFSYTQANEMEKSGYIKIYSHYTKHTLATGESAERFALLSERSFKYLEERINTKRQRFFAYPCGEYSLETAETLRSLGACLQLVQQLPEDFNGEDYGFVLRRNVAYDTDVLSLVGSIE